MFSLDTPVADIPRYGKLFAKRLLKLKITTVRYLLLYFPFRYDDLSRVVPIAQVRIGDRITIRGTIIALQNRRTFRRRLIITEALVRDASATIKVIWFNQAYLTRVLAPHENVWLAGTVVDDGYGLHLTNPIYEKVDMESLHTGRIVPLYSLTGSLTQKQLRILIRCALPVAPLLADDLPALIRAPHQLLPIADAVRILHFPESLQEITIARRRFAFAEFFTLQIGVLERRSALRHASAPRIRFFEKETKDFVVALPFVLTNDQRKVAWEILQAMTRAESPPMRRLLNGDVGSGKTAVAAIVMLNVVLSGYRSVLLAPTEILAEQHARTLTQFFRHTPLRIVLATAAHKSTKKDRDAANIFVGTHALFHLKNPLENLGLVIVDEQHRFGVAQRSVLLDMKTDATSHLLLMTATPIPRTLAQTIFGDFDISIIRALPKGRKPIVTRIVEPTKRDAAYHFVRKEIIKGRQAFVVCPLIDPSDLLGVRAATDVYDHLRNTVFPDIAIGLLHGRMKQKDRERVMRGFLENTIAVLVATSVIEVGIDIPNASLMLIEGAERFGLAQLHQLRGRVGRGAHASYCLLFTESVDTNVHKRLQVVARSQDGFALAEADLRFRGPGEIFGFEQSGYGALRFARWNDLALMRETKDAAIFWHKKNPSASSMADGLFPA